MLSQHENKTIPSNIWTIPFLLEKMPAILQAVYESASEAYWPLCQSSEELHVLDKLAFQFIEKLHQISQFENHNLPITIGNDDIPYNKFLRGSRTFNSISFKNQPFSDVTVEGCCDERLNVAIEAAHHLSQIRNWLIHSGKKFADNMCHRFNTLYKAFKTNIPSEYLLAEKSADELIKYQFVCYTKIPTIKPDNIEEIRNWAKSISEQIESHLDKELDEAILHFNKLHPLPDSELSTVIFEKGSKQLGSAASKLPSAIRQNIFSFVTPAAYVSHRHKTDLQIEEKTSDLNINTHYFFQISKPEKLLEENTTQCRNWFNTTI